MVAIILDILVLVIIGLSVFMAYKKGLIRTLFSLVGFIAAVALAVSFSKPVAAWVDVEFVGPVVRNTVLTAVNGSDLDLDYDEALSKVDVVATLREMPESLKNFLENINVDVDELIESAENSDRESKLAKERLIDSIAAPISASISRTISLIALILIFLALLFVVTRLLDAVFKILPLGNNINKTGGILFGIVRGVAFVLIFSAIAYGLAKGNVLIKSDQLDDTLLVRLINEYNPILKLF